MLAGTPKMPSHPNGTPRRRRPGTDLHRAALENPELPGAITSEVARRQPDGTWLWVIDEGEGGLPTVVGGFEVGGWDVTAASNNRRWLNQPTYSRVAIST
ncbi:hypothetical protein [Streptomyces himalayensis]|uniref:hypothetical protein n=1 Tax=Streptomyces himalayensis TaxID=2820085 RepID=UPI001C69E8CF|nr:hypothetical protein [Streptomyces himalayensis]